MNARKLSSHQKQTVAAVIISVFILGFTYYTISSKGTSERIKDESESALSTNPSNESQAANCDIKDIDQSLKIISREKLAKYNGVDKEQLYIGYNCLIYDVTEGGADYYGPDKPYHYLVGRDATEQLVQFGGSTIEEKYPVIGRLE